MRYKLVFLSLVLAVLGTGCSNEIKKKDVAGQTASKDVCADDATRDNQFFCLSSAVKVDCSVDVNSAACTKDKFLNEGYGGFAYPQPIVTFFNTMYSRYVNQYYAANKLLPPYVHFGEYFGLLYDETLPAKDAKPSDVTADLAPVGIVTGGTVANDVSVIDGIAYKSESCALCHLGIANDGFYRFGVPNNHLKYGGLKLAFNRFICYAEAAPGTEYAGLDTKCAATVDLTKLSDSDQEQCKTYAAFKMSSGNAALLAIWQDSTLFPADVREQLLTALQSSVRDSSSACDAVGKMLPPLDHNQVVELSKWDGIHYPDGTVITDTEASRIDRFYHSVMTVNGTPRTTINDGVHAPVKIPLLANLVSTEAAAAGNYGGNFLGSGVLTSLQQYVHLHAALEGGQIVTVPDDATLAPLMQFLAGLKLPKPDTAASTLESDAYKTGQALFEQRCAVCHDESHSPVDYVADAGTDFTYATALVAPNVSPRSLQADIKALTPLDSWNESLPPGLVFSSLKQPRLQGLWTARSFLHNGMSQSLQNLFCVPGNASFRTTQDNSGNPIYAAPFLDSGHNQTCAADLTAEQRQDLITYLLTL